MLHGASTRRWGAGASPVQRSLMPCGTEPIVVRSRCGFGRCLLHDGTVISAEGDLIGQLQPRTSACSCVSGAWDGCSGVRRAQGIPERRFSALCLTKRRKRL